MPSVSNVTPPSQMGITDATTGTSGSSSTANAKDKVDKNKIDSDMFLKLLVTQLKYQDPLNPAKPDDFLAQTAQFTTVEKLTQLAEESAKSSLGQRMTTASSMIGKSVSYAEGAGTSTGTVRSARITDTGDIMLNIGGDKELSLLEIKTIGLPADIKTAGATTN